MKKEEPSVLKELSVLKTFPRKHLHSLLTLNVQNKMMVDVNYDGIETFSIIKTRQKFI